MKKGSSKTVEEYKNALQKYASVRDEKPFRQFDNIYEEPHIAGYYRDMLHSVTVVKGAFKTARSFIKRLAANKKYLFCEQGDVCP